MIRNAFRSLPFVALVLLANACGGGQTTDDNTPPPPVIEYIPGLNHDATASFYEGIAAMEATPTNYRGALESFERAYELDANFWEAVENIGLLQMDLGLYAEAAQSFQTELEIIERLVADEWPVSSRPEVYLNLGKALSLARRTTDAAQAFAALLEIDPDNVEARANLAALNLQANNLEGSRQYIAELLEMSRDDLGALNVLALNYKSAGDMQMASYLWERALGLIAVAQQTLSDEAQYAELTEDEASALRQYNTGRLERMVKVQSDINNELGVIAWTNGEEDQAETYFFNAVALNSSNAAAHLNLATVYLDFADFATAQFHFDEALALRPSDEAGLIGRAACLYGLGETDAAWDAFLLAFETHQDNEYAARRLGDISFTERTDYASAIEWYTRNLGIRGLTASTCDRGSDQVCASLNTAIELQASAPAPEN